MLFRSERAAACPPAGTGPAATWSPAVDAVSYTHLDVYKRQIFYGYLYQEKKCFGLDYNDLIVFVLYLFEQNPAIPVSYTHLDVYKRQVVDGRGERIPAIG